MNPKVITLGSFYIISEKCGKRRKRKFYTPEMAAEKLNISDGQLQSLMMLLTVRPCFIRFESPFLLDEDIKTLRKMLKPKKSTFKIWRNKNV